MIVHRVFLRLLILSVLLCVPTPTHAQQLLSPNTSRVPQVQLKVNHIRLTGVSPDAYKFDAELQLKSSVTADIENLSFLSLRLNGEIPLFLAPLQMHVALRQDEWTPLPPLQITIYAADLPSLAPLQSIVETGEAHVQGEARAELQLPVVARLFMWMLHPTVVSVLNQQVTLEQGAVNPWTVRGLALGTLTQQGANVLRGLLGLGDSAVGTSASQDLLRSVVLVHTSYRVQAGASASTHTLDRLGFWIAPHLVLVPEEVLDPWAYSPFEADELASGIQMLNKASVELTIRPALDQSQASTEWSLARRDFAVYRRGKPEKTRLVLSSQARDVEVLARDSGSNFAVLKFRDNITGEPLPLTACRGQQCEPALLGGVDIVRENPAAGQSILFGVNGSQSGDRPVLSRPLDDRCFGSPLLSSQGVVGMVGSERGIIPAAVLRDAAGVGDPEPQR